MSDALARLIELGEVEVEALRGALAALESSRVLADEAVRAAQAALHGQQQRSLQARRSEGASRIGDWRIEEAYRDEALELLRRGEARLRAAEAEAARAHNQVEATREALTVRLAQLEAARRHRARAVSRVPERE